MRVRWLWSFVSLSLSLSLSLFDGFSLERERGGEAVEQALDPP